MSVAEMPRQRRKPREPRHPFAVKHNPYAITPFCVAPVLPGETLKSFQWQARAVTDPIKSPLVGWHLEYYWFYVKFRDLAISSALTDMMVNPDRSMTDVQDLTTDVSFYHPGTAGNINFTKEAYKSIIEYWFRNDGEAWNSYMIGNYAAAQINGNSWLDSVSLTGPADIAAEPQLVVGGDGYVTPSEIDTLMRKWQILREQGLTNQTYEEFLMTYGVNMGEVEVNKPELLRYVKTWQYPSNTVEPTTGVPTSAVSWTVQERADKDRYFKEPGWIIGLTVARPKVYRSNQRGSLAHLMNTVYQWMPATLRDDPQVGVKAIANTNALLNGITPATSYWVDLKDLLMYGDQFVNFAMTETDMGLVALPSATMNWQYPTQAMIQTLFNGTKYDVRQDGVAQFNILGQQQDMYTNVNGR